MNNLYAVNKESGNVVVQIVYDKRRDKFRFVNLTRGHICTCEFETVLDAVNDMKDKKYNGEIIDFIKI